MFVSPVDDENRMEMDNTNTQKPETIPSSGKDMEIEKNGTNLIGLKAGLSSSYGNYGNVKSVRPSSKMTRNTMINQSSSNKKKKLKIKPFKVQPKLPSNFEETTWEKLKCAISAIQKKETTQYSKEELYRATEDLCLHNWASKLYDRLISECDNYIQKKFEKLKEDRCLSLSNDNYDTDSFAMLEKLNLEWQDHCESMFQIRDIFLYLDRKYVMQTTGIKPIWEAGLWSFRHAFTKDENLMTQSMLLILHLIALDRNKQVINYSLLRSLVRMLISLGIYKEAFLPRFINESYKYFFNEANQKIASLDIPEYLIYVEERLKEAREMIDRYLEQNTKQPLIVTLETTLLQPHIETIIARGFTTLMDTGRLNDLKRLYTLFKRIDVPLNVTSKAMSSSSMHKDSSDSISNENDNMVEEEPALKYIESAFANYIKNKGKFIVEDENREGEMVNDMLQLKAKCDMVVKESFFSDENMKTAVKVAFQQAINSKANKPAQLLAKYLDMKLRSSTKALLSKSGAAHLRNLSVDLNSSKRSDDNLKETSTMEDQGSIENILEGVMVLFRFLNGKDTFEAFYRKDLAKRLLLDRSSSDELEKSILAKLKAECGTLYTKNLEGMFKDMELSREFMSSYSEYQEKEKQKQIKTQDSESISREIDTTISILTVGYWPQYQPVDGLVFPPEMIYQMTKFESYYTNKYQGRKLTWQHSLGQLVVNASFPKGRKELQLSLYQGLVLLCFNTLKTNYSPQKEIDDAAVDKASSATSPFVTKLTYEDIKIMTGMSDDAELQRTLQSLFGKKDTRLVIKEPKTKEITSTDTFQLNLGFTHPRIRIKMPNILLKENLAEDQETHESVFRDRQYQVDAIIVRIMKARQRLNHQQLLSELVTQLKFPARPADLKKRIESLIDRDYLERDENNPQVYNYLA